MSHLSALLEQTSTALTEYSQTDARQVLTDIEDYYLRFFIPFVEEVRSNMCPVQQLLIAGRFLVGAAMGFICVVPPLSAYAVDTPWNSR
ncbi:hypothetical protein RvY_18961 [Ramazzottius varieornatus]|uniref:Uncharacterized protein n=1 Tax=Ramazzottius varieornatus TaxID=947166 RepID=A0A1D1WBC6_RAMVA|nr:hypothetical protein RvY_18961 [Ramazzottius varieornatus]